MVAGDQIVEDLRATFAYRNQSTAIALRPVEYNLVAFHLRRAIFDGYATPPIAGLVVTDVVIQHLTTVIPVDDYGAAKAAGSVIADVVLFNAWSLTRC